MLTVGSSIPLQVVVSVGVNRAVVYTKCAIEFPVSASNALSDCLLLLI